mmetsp:Transcript_57354/g.117401  ORF Transcript_57354/g.117401 Transcript_57354/m.117401 type:complete len:563 (-) Transcript_57354:195-1883(-)
MSAAAVRSLCIFASWMVGYAFIAAPPNNFFPKLHDRTISNHRHTYSPLRPQQLQRARQRERNSQAGSVFAVSASGSLVNIVSEPSPPPAKVLGAVEHLGGRVTAADVASEVGISLHDAKAHLTVLARLVGDLEVSSEGELVYVFEKNFRYQLLQRSAKGRLQHAWHKTSPALVKLMKASFGVVLLTSMTVIYTSIISILICALFTDKDNSSGSSAGLYHASRLVVDLIDLAVRIVLELSWRRSVDRKSRREMGRMSFLESIFSFVFGDSNPNANLQNRRKTAVAQLARDNGGVLVAEQLAPWMDPESEYSRAGAGGAGQEEEWGNGESEAYVLPVLTELGGRPEVTEEGNIVYVFDDLLASTSSSSSSSPDETRLSNRSFLEEKERPFSKASKGQLVMASMLGALHVVGGLMLTSMLTEMRRLPPLLLQIKAFLPFMVAFGVSILVVPLLRALPLYYYNRGVRQRNRIRMSWRAALQAGPVQRKLRESDAWRQGLRVIKEGDVDYTSSKGIVEQGADLKRFDNMLGASDSTGQNDNKIILTKSGKCRPGDVDASGPGAAASA